IQTDVPHSSSRDNEGEEAPLSHNAFWGPAVRRFGLAATEGPVAVLKIISILFLVLVFWALFDQHGTTWVRQAQQLDLKLPWGGTADPAQIPALNPLMVMLLIPLLNLVYAGCDRIGLKATPLRRITVGMFIASSSFIAVALLQMWIESHGIGVVW